MPPRSSSSFSYYHIALCYIAILGATCVYMFYQSTSLHYEDLAEFRTNLQRKRLGVVGREGASFMNTINMIGNFFKSLPTWGNGLKDRAKMLKMASMNFKSGAQGDSQLVMAGAYTAMSMVNRYGGVCFLLKPYQDQIVIVLETIVLWIFLLPLYYIYWLLLAVVSLENHAWFPFKILFGYGRALVDYLKPRIPPLKRVVDWHDSLYLCKDTLSSEDIQYNLKTVLPIMHKNASTYMSRAMCNLDFAVRPPEI